MSGKSGESPRLLIRIDQKEFVAELHRDVAPKTCDAILTRLPIKGKVIHARWSGEAIWMSLEDQPIKVAFENQTMHPSRGELLFYPGFVSEKELLIPYGASSFASKSGVSQETILQPFLKRLTNQPQSDAPSCGRAPRTFR